jgi:hypothetical protein
LPSSHLGNWRRLWEARRLDFVIRVGSFFIKNNQIVSGRIFFFKLQRIQLHEETSGAMEDSPILVINIKSTRHRSVTHGLVI